MGQCLKIQAFRVSSSWDALVMIMSTTMRSDDTDTSTGAVRVIQPYEDGRLPVRSRQLVARDTPAAAL